ncbi:hypothetical protein OFB63_36145, partial [Escherichia coli]|nr:hypothetical protein [Escherichia coli]
LFSPATPSSQDQHLPKQDIPAKYSGPNPSLLSPGKKKIPGNISCLSSTADMIAFGFVSPSMHRYFIN